MDFDLHQGISHKDFDLHQGKTPMDFTDLT